ncbi:MAG: tripartite tricarboxylate transporter TctB family protein [Defluviitaleaceae bacterium]|nr:tripartite tricarboxylate transporter TctB family protein [Defluviitaleaceae bacterium]
MSAIGSFLATLWWPLVILVFAVYLGLVWLLIRPFSRLRPYTGQLLVLMGVFGVGLMFFVISFSFPAPAPILRAVTDASTIPRVWFFALVPVTVIALIPIIRGKDEPDPKWGNVRLVAVVLTALIVSIGLFGVIGYYVSSALFIVVLMWVLGSRNKVELLAVPAGWVVFSYFIFARLLNVRLPIGSVFAAILG